MSKRVIFFFITIFVVIVAIVLCFTLFTVKKIDVVAFTQSELIDSEKIISSANIETGSNIFSLKEKKIVYDVEKANPYVKVQSVVRRFPNKVVINVDVRHPLIRMQLTESEKIAVLDSELAIINIVQPEDEILKNITEISGFSILGNGDGLLGEKLSFSDITTKNLGTVIESYYKIFHESESAFTTFIPKIVVNDHAKCIEIHTNKGLVILIRTNVTIGVLEQSNASYSGYNDMLIKETVDMNKGYFYLDIKGWCYTPDFPELS